MLLGLFVGGRARRMGGHPKGLLPAPETGEPIVVRLARIGTELGLEPVFVGDATPYRAVLPDLVALADDPPGIGPLGGLAALLAASDAAAIALACDMPYVPSALIARLVQAPIGPHVIAPRSTAGLWDPLCARYDANAVAPVLAAELARGTRSFQRLFATLRVTELALDPEERAALSDWDALEDVPVAARPRPQ
jgi:molybdenum cofactor guanylyltransferase